MKAGLERLLLDKWTMHSFKQFFSSSPDAWTVCVVCGLVSSGIILTNLTYLSVGVWLARTAGVQESSPAIIIIIEKIHYRHCHSSLVRGTRLSSITYQESSPTPKSPQKTVTCKTRHNKFEQAVVL